MMNIVFRNARKDERETIYTLYQSVLGTPFCVWNTEYPGFLEIDHDLETDNLFVLETDRRIIGAVSIVPENELDEFSCWHAVKNAGEFARVVIHPEYQGKQLSKVLILNVLEKMKARGFENIHISVATENTPAQHTYRHFGFTEAGQAEMWGHRYYLYELALDE